MRELTVHSIASPRSGRIECTVTVIARNCRCDGPMRLVAIEPHSRFVVMDIRHFACNCGHDYSETVPRYWLGALAREGADDPA